MAKTLSIIFGIVFIIIGILGFVGNPLVGEGATFVTNTAHDIVHLVSGIVLLLAGFSSVKAGAAALKTIGIIYLIVTILGFVLSSPMLGIIEYNAADNWLHLVLAVILILAGLKGGKGEDMPADAPPMSQPTM